ncbi:MAG: flagellar export chaperone FliS [Terriglobales bacterium]|jgi:flagellar protein FliS
MNIRQSYREASVQGANPVQLVVRLYEQLIEDMRQVTNAIDRNDIPLRTERIRHALLVIGHLQSALDFAQGGLVARHLDDLYNTLRRNVVAVQFRPSKRGVAQLITDLLVLREAWVEVERAEYPTAASVAPMARSGAYEAAYAGGTDSRPDPEINEARAEQAGLADESRRREWNG